jgi:hypothetical protein
MLRNGGYVVNVAVIRIGFVVGGEQAFDLLHPDRLEYFETHMAIEEKIITRTSRIDHEGFNHAYMFQ